MNTRFRASPRSRLSRTLKPRKSPSQGRAEATFEAILCASAHILATEGWEAVNTNRVALEAGISIGSLYQYFPGRDAILAELGRRHAFQMVGATRAALETTQRLPLLEAVRATIRVAIRLHEDDPALHRAIEDETPSLGPMDWRAAAHAQTHQIIFQSLALRANEIGAQDFEFLAFFSATIVEGVVHQAMTARPADLKTGRIEAELIDIVMYALTRGWKNNYISHN